MSQTWTQAEIDARIAQYLIDNPPAGSGDFVKATDDTDDITQGATNKFATQAEKDKLGFISVTQAVNLDTMESDIAGKAPALGADDNYVTDAEKTKIGHINTATSGVGATPTASGTTAITHGLGRIPTIIRISAKSGFTSNAAATPTTSSEGRYTSSGNACIYQGINGTTTIAAVSSTAFAVFLDTSAGNSISGVIQNVGATTFDIVWTETGTHTRGVYLWEAQ